MWSESSTCSEVTSVTARTNAARLVSHYLRFCTAAVSTTGKSDDRRAKTEGPRSEDDNAMAAVTNFTKPSPEYMDSMFDLIRGWVPQQEAAPAECAGPAASGEKAIRKLDIAVLKCMAAILSVGPCTAELQGKAYKAIKFFLQRSSHNRDAVTEALSVLLKNNPKSSRNFMISSCPEIHMPKQVTATKEAKSHARELAHCYYDALTENLMKELPSWLSAKHISLAQMLLALFLFQNSTDPEVRQLTINLANEMVGLKNGFELDPGEGILRASPHPSPHIYLESALCYSRSLASRYKELTAPLLVELSMLNDPLIQENRDWMLRVILPWIENFSFNLKQERASPSQDSKPTRSILESLFVLTRQNAHGAVHLGTLWQQLMRNQENVELVVSDVIEFLLHKHSEASSHEDRSLCSMIIVFVSRTECSELILEALVSELRNYEESMPETPEVSFYHLHRFCLNFSFWLTLPLALVK